MIVEQVGGFNCDMGFGGSEMMLRKRGSRLARFLANS